LSTLLHPGFADPVRDSQAAFRAVLDAMARPGRIHTLAAPAEPPPPLERATAAVLLTLADADTPLWFDPAAAAARDWASFHCGASFAAIERATLAVALALPNLARLAVGTDEAPEGSATLILQIAALGSGLVYRLEGPGLAEPATLQAAGLPQGFADAWAANRRLFPQGIDVILCAGDRVAALPRTVRLENA
jgi:alpha-D-ribose 1-methylphosphonate 5-triphosphate synthase subunit PhnH